MGLLADYLNRKRLLEDRAAFREGMTGLLGQAPGVFEADLFPGEQPIPGLKTAGTGLLANINDPANRARFAAGLMQLPGGMNLGAGMLNQQFGGIDAMARQQASLAQNQAQFEENQRRLAQQFGIGLLAKQNQQQQWTPQDILKATTEQQTQAMKQLAAPRQQLQYFQSATDIVRNRGGFAGMTGADDLALVTQFSKLLRPGEAVMSDDVQNALNTLGYGDMVNMMIGASKGEQLTETQRAEIYGTMSTLAGRAEQQAQNIRGMVSQRLQGTPVQAGQVLPQAVPFQPLGSAALQGQQVPTTGQIQRGGLMGRPEQQAGARAEAGLPVAAVPPGVPFLNSSDGKTYMYNEQGELMVWRDE